MKTYKMDQMRKMNENTYLKRLFQAYYKEHQSSVPVVDAFERREFGFVPWEKFMMIRHVGYNDPEIFKKFLISNGPRHVYSSGSLYQEPENQTMANKKYLGCDLIIDIDVDHFYTPCKEDHDFWYCKECGTNGKGMPPKKCPNQKCGQTKIKALTWICKECLNVAKNEIIKLIYEFLLPDFNINENEINIAFSGHRGYHLKIDNKEIRTLSSEQRREMVDYVTGNNISFEVLGLREMGSNIFGLLKGNIGWSQKIILKIEEILKNFSNARLEELLSRFGIDSNRIQSFINYRNDFLKIISNEESSLWNIEGFGILTWNKFLRGIVDSIGAEIDEPVTIDIHRLIRYPETLHGKTGFKVQELELNQLEDFNPLHESSEELNPIVFKGETVQKLKITEPYVPSTELAGEKFPSYNQGQIIEVPHHFAVFLLCKGVAKLL
ncbi:MAG: hypothetical protein EU539_02660 [Promethearchaeota archaeon]|nr:MAG: hypothetical protein EU539_02660 [Candidatus Lokiarchaeota archaeon]